MNPQMSQRIKWACRNIPKFLILRKISQNFRVGKYLSGHLVYHMPEKNTQYSRPDKWSFSLYLKISYEGECTTFGAIPYEFIQLLKS